MEIFYWYVYFFYSLYHESWNNKIIFHIQESHNIGIIPVNLILIQTPEWVSFHPKMYIILQKHGVWR